MKGKVTNSNREYFDELYAKPNALWFAMNGFFSFNQKSKCKINWRMLKEACAISERPFPPAKVMDFGCGFGAFLFRFPRRVKIFGVDISKHAISHCQKIAAIFGRKGEFVVADGSDRLPWEDGSFEAIVTSHTLEHVENESVVMGELVRCLRPGGILLINVPINETVKDEKHAREYSRGHLEALFKEFGLSAILFNECDRFGGMLAVRESRLSTKIGRVLSRIVRGFLALLPQPVWALLDHLMRARPFQQLIGVARKG